MVRLLESGGHCSRAGLLHLTYVCSPFAPGWWDGFLQAPLGCVASLRCHCASFRSVDPCRSIVTTVRFRFSFPLLPLFFTRPPHCLQKVVLESPRDSIQGMKSRSFNGCQGIF